MVSGNLPSQLEILSTGQTYYESANTSINIHGSTLKCVTKRVGNVTTTNCKQGARLHCGKTNFAAFVENMLYVNKLSEHMSV